MKGLSSHHLRRAGAVIRRYGLGFLAASALGFAPAAHGQSAAAQSQHPQAQTFEEFLNGPEGAILDSHRAQDPVPDNFRRQLFAVAPQSQGRIGVAALDLTTGQTVSIEGDEPFPMASTSKIAIAATFLAGVDAGKYSLFDRYPLMVPVASEPFSSKVAPVRAGQTMTAETLIERMITRSDNQATDALLAVVGGPQAVNAWMRKAGLNRFRIDRDIATLVRDRWEFDLSRHVDVRDSTPPEEMVELIAGLHQGKWLSPASRGLLIGAMTRTVTGSSRIKAGLPSGVTFGHKTGTLNKTASDVGFVTMPDGRVVVMAIYVTGQSGPAARNAKIAEITRTIYNGFSVPPARHASNDNAVYASN